MYTSQKFAENLFLEYCRVAQVAPQIIKIVMVSKDEANSPGAYIHDNLPHTQSTQHWTQHNSIGQNTEHNNNGAVS